MMTDPSGRKISPEGNVETAQQRHMQTYPECTVTYVYRKEIVPCWGHEIIQNLAIGNLHRQDTKINLDIDNAS